MKVKEAMKLFSKWKHAQLDEDIVKALGIQEIADQTYRELSTGSATSSPSGIGFDGTS